MISPLFPLPNQFPMTLTTPENKPFINSIYLLQYIKIQEDEIHCEVKDFAAKRPTDN